MADDPDAAVPGQELHAQIQGMDADGWGGRNGGCFGRPECTSPHSIHVHAQVVFKVNQGATSPLVFGASVWQNNVKLYDSAPISVSVCRGAGGVT